MANSSPTLIYLAEREYRWCDLWCEFAHPIQKGLRVGLFVLDARQRDAQHEGQVAGLRAGAEFRIVVGWTHVIDELLSADGLSGIFRFVRRSSASRY